MAILLRANGDVFGGFSKLTALVPDMDKSARMTNLELTTVPKLKNASMLKNYIGSQHKQNFTFLDSKNVIAELDS